jgi:hypothetical protein
MRDGSSSMEAATDPNSGDALLPDSSSDKPDSGSLADASNVETCSPSPCQHGGSCSRTAEGVVCDCAETGYEGARCEIDIDECSLPNLCKNPEYPCAQTEPPGYTCEGHMADWPMPDAVLSANVRPSYDVESVPGVVLDKVTGLAWQRELPAVYDRCSGNIDSAGDSCTWEEAKSYCNRLALARHEDWRLPSKIELESILDDTRAEAPAIDLAVFSGTSLQHYWTRSTAATDAQAAWLLFGHVLAKAYPKSTTAFVRCVYTMSPVASGTPGSRYTVSGGSGLYPDVVDRWTGLVWKKSAESGSTTLEEARTACAAYGGAWRVPTRKELLTLVNAAGLNASTTVDPVFTGPVDTVYRSVSTLAGNTGLLIGVDFRSGATLAVQNVDPSFVRCVR